MNETLTSLQKKLKKSEKEVDKLREEIEEKRLVRGLPSLKKKYEGKYFKYLNSYGNGTSWWLYIYCHEVVGLNEMLVTRFQVTPNECEFKIYSHEFEFLLQQQITKEEYDSAAENFVTACSRIKIK